MGSLVWKKRRNKMNQTNAIGNNWKDVWKEHFTQEEIRKSDERVVKNSKTIDEQKKSKRKKNKNHYGIS